MNNINDYTIVIRPDDNGTYIAYIPAIKGCHAWGETPEDARSELNHVFEMIGEEYFEENKNLPSNVQITISYAS